MAASPHTFNVRVRRPGCGVMSALLGGAALAGGVHLMNTWDHANGVGRAAAVVLVMLGTLLLIPAALSLLLLAGVWYVKRRVARVVGPMMAMIGQQSSLWADDQQHRPAVAADFAALDRDWYQATTAALVAVGYRHLGDVVNQTMAEAAGRPTVLRVLASADGTTAAAVYHVRLPTGSDRVVEFDTELTDGTFVVTGNSADEDLITPTPAIRRHRELADTPPGELVRAHAANLAGRDVIPVRTLADVLAAHARQYRLKAAHRKSVNAPAGDDVRRIGYR